jgi:hypothetical protein
MTERLASTSVRRLFQFTLLIAAIGAGCGKGAADRNGGTSGSAGTTGGGGIAGTGAAGSGGVAGTGVAGSAGTGLAGTGGVAGATDGGARDADAGDGVPIVPAFAAAARGFAAEYLAWGRVDDELRWAPWLCRIPLPGVTRPSQSNDSSTHGQKLYSVFAKNHAAYPSGPQTDQVVVKQSWTAELVTTPDAAYAPASERYPTDAGDHFYGYAKGDGGVVYRAANLAGLYIMFKLPEATPDTDQGWVYATLTAAGEVTAAGRVASCMGCHEVATHERLFGVPLSPSFP